MVKFLTSVYKKFDFILLTAAIILIIIGISTLQSMIVAATSDHPVLNERLLNVQTLAIVTGTLLFFGLMLFDYRYMSYLAIPIYVLLVAGLAIVLLIGVETRGSLRWIEIGPINIQPSTIASLWMVTVFASYFAVVREKINNLLYLLIGGLILLPPFGLILVQPDLGMSIILAIVWLGMLHLTPIRATRLVLVYLLILLSIPIGWNHLAEYQKQRLATFINPAEDPLGAGYNTLQSVIAVGSGQLFGRGWGRGTQSHLQFLPEQHTDFIFAAFAEEQGFFGASLIIILYGILIWRAFNLLQQTPNYFGQLIVGGVTFWLAAHVTINIAMNLGTAPITGIPLPLISYGGTSTVTAFMALGLLQSITLRKNL